MSDDPIWENYFSALGRFMHAFAKMEDGLNSVVAQYLYKKTSSFAANTFPILQAATGGRRFKPLKETLERLLKVAGETNTVRDRIAKILAHVSEIQYLRDRLAHNGADYSEKDAKFRTLNAVTVLDGERADLVFFTPEMLVAAAGDLHRIAFMILRQIDPGFTQVADQHLGGIESYRDRIAELEAPWKYRPGDLVRKPFRTSPPTAQATKSTGKKP